MWVWIDAGHAEAWRALIDQFIGRFEGESVFSDMQEDLKRISLKIDSRLSGRRIRHHAYQGRLLPKPNFDLVEDGELVGINARRSELEAMRKTADIIASFGDRAGRMLTHLEEQMAKAK